MRVASVFILILANACCWFPVEALSKNNNTNSTAVRHQRGLRRQQRNRLLSTVDPLVVERYKKVKTGQRKHPSYYSEKYLTRAREYTAEQTAELAQKWGAWKLEPSSKHPSASDDFYTQFPNRDVPYDQFPDTAWQKDQAYVQDFLTEGIDLAERGLEAILSEYGLGKDDLEGKDFAERSAKFTPAHGPGKEQDSGGWMTTESFDHLKRRILHAVVSEDSFNMAMAGHSAAAGHGNHFQQVYTSVIQRILEPVFARLGVKMTCRNFGLGGLGTLQNGVAAADMFGRDLDIMMWDASMTEKEPSARGILAIQSLVGMDKAPMQWYQHDSGNVLSKINSLTGADYGTYGTATKGGWPKVSTAAELSQLPWALQYTCCPKDLGDYCRSLRWQGKCWQDRSNFMWEGMDLSYSPPTAGTQAEPGGRAGWHPGNREHQLVARIFTFTILLALRDALKTWKEKPDLTLTDTDWHMTDLVSGIKNKVVEHKDEWAPWCKEKKISEKYCIHAAKGRTENTPRNRPWETSIRAIMSGSGHQNMNLGDNLYDPPDVYNPFLDPPEGQVDVLGILENGPEFPKNLARIRDSAEDMEGVFFSEEGTGSKHNMEIKAGKGWQFETQDLNAASDNCDGTHDSWCRRRLPCLMYGHNDARTGIFIDGFSGWLIFTLPQVEKGNIMVKFHTWAFFPPKITEGWCSENNETPCTGRALSSGSNSSSTHRMLKPPVPNYCDDFKFEFAIDGKITSWTKDETLAHQAYAQRVVEFFTLLDEDEWDGPKDVELALRVTGCGRQKPFDLTHVYWI